MIGLVGIYCGIFRFFKWPRVGMTNTYSQRARRNIYKLEDIESVSEHKPPFGLYAYKSGLTLQGSAQARSLLTN